MQQFLSVSIRAAVSQISPRQVLYQIVSLCRIAPLRPVVQIRSPVQIRPKREAAPKLRRGSIS